MKQISTKVVKGRNDHSDTNNVTNHWPSPKKIIITAVSLFISISAFQNCSQANFSVGNGNGNGGGAQSLSGGTGTDGMRYINYGSCGGVVGVSSEIDVSAGAATVVLQNCNILSTPFQVSGVNYSIDSNSVLVWNNLIFDLQTQPTSQRITTNFCVGSTGALQLNAATWVSTANPYTNLGSVVLSDSTSTGPLILIGGANNVFTSDAGQSSGMILDLQSMTVTYSEPGIPFNSMRGIQCLSQPLPPGGRRPVQPVYSWLQYGDWSACTQSCGGGIQTQTVMCVDSTTNLPAPTPADCTSFLQPSATQQCNVQSCGPSPSTSFSP